MRRAALSVAVVAGAALAGCSTLPRTGEAPVGYRVHCTLQPSGAPLVPPNFVRHGCVEVPGSRSGAGAVIARG